jgi:L-histidine Nalpha-methyltransferase
LKKSIDIVLPAYNDAQGYTRDFNLNLLRRINNELDADFDLSKFEHKPVYDESKGIALSYLRSTENQTVNITALDCSFSFAEGEVIHTEVSRKYDRQLVDALIKNTDLEIKAWITDSKEYFSDVILEKH